MIRFKKIKINSDKIKKHFTTEFMNKKKSFTKPA